MTDLDLWFSPALLWTLAFAALLLKSLALRFWLGFRQTRHVMRHRQAVPAAYEGAVTLAAHQKAADYSVAKLRLATWTQTLDAAVLVGWTLLGGLAALDQFLLSVLGPGWGQPVVLVLAFVLIGGILDLPANYYQTFVLEQRFGFNAVTPRLWWADLLKSLLLGAAIGLPLLALLLWVMGALGALWWLWAWGLWMGVQWLLLLIYPTWIAPIFNRFTPLQDEALRARVTALMQRCGFAAQGLFVMDGSKRSAHANAYFTGFGAAKRVVFYDTLLARLSPAEVIAVLAHELGHFKHRHVLKRLLALSVLSFLGFALLGALSGQSWFYLGLGVEPHLHAPNNALALLLFALVLPVLGFWLSPWLSRASRRHEFEADAYAVSHASGKDLRTALLKLYQDNAATLTPDPWYARFYASHPPALERLAHIQALSRS